MRHGRRWSIMLAAGMVTPALIAPASAADSGTNVCYKEVDVDRDRGGDNNNERVVLNVDRQSGLTFPGGYTQSVFEAVGKNTDTEGKNQIMAAAQGTIIVTTKGGSPADLDHGAHMGLVAIWVRPDGAAKNYDCYSEQESATPAVWHCAVRDQNEGLKLDRATLTRLTVPDQYCGIFQDDVIESKP
jgi:hypothetical protein